VSALAVGVDVGGTRTKVGIADRDGRMLAQRVHATVLDDGEAFLSRLEADVAELLAETGRRRDELAGIGLAVPGFVDQQGERIAMVWERVAYLERRGLRAAIAARLGLPCAIDNDAQAAATGEARVGAGVGAMRLLALTIGTGLGFAFLVDGRPRDAAPLSHMAGHLPIGAPPAECICGIGGCLESAVSARGFQRAYRAAGGSEDAPPEDIAARARAGERAAAAAIAALTDRLVDGLDAYLLLLAPDRVVIGGGLAAVLDPAELQRRIRARPFPAHRVAVVRSALQERAGIVGAALLAFAARGHP
jgi:glucokinase